MHSVRMRGICKSYGSLQALKEVDFELKKGTIHALLGENGAGKTTLMKILYAMEPADAGTIELNEQEVHMHDSLDAIREGIGMVHQHFMLVPSLSVMENIVANQEPRQGIRFDKKKALADVKALCDKIGFNVNPRARISSLSVGQCQRVEILKVLYRGADILIFDEPTAVLTPLEVDDFFVTLRQLKEQGKSIVIITHKLHEVMEIADEITVLRDGRLVGSADKGSVTRASLAQMMVGREVAMGTRRRASSFGEVMCEIKNLNYSKNGSPVLTNVNLTIRKGEIVGIAGVEGNGQSELIEILTGLLEADSLDMVMNNISFSGKSVRSHLRCGVGHVPEDRMVRGLAGRLSVEENLVLGYENQKPFSKAGFMQWKNVESHGASLIASFGIKASSGKVRVNSLSGGNQQKIVVARVFSQEPDFVICAQPTRGVDIAAAEYIHKVMFDYRDRGKAVLLISADLDEIKNVSDTVAVIYKGEIKAIDKTDEFDDFRLGLLMTGMTDETVQEGM